MMEQLSNKLVSIIVPAYNREKEVVTTLDSLRAQTYPSIEIIVVDDGSKDNTKFVVQEYINKYNNKPFPISLIVQENKGLPGARNTGIFSSSGDYVLCFDSDDIMMPNRVEKQVEAMLHDEADLCAAAFDSYRNGKLHHHNYHYVWQGISNVDQIFNFYSKKGKGVRPSTQAWMHSRTLINQLGGYDEDLRTNQDIDIAFRAMLIPNVKFTIINEPLSIFVDDDNPNRIMKSLWKTDLAIKCMEKIQHKLLSSDFILSHAYTFRNAAFFYMRSFVKNNMRIKGTKWGIDKFKYLWSTSLNMSFADVVACKTYCFYLLIVTIVNNKFKK